MKKYSLLKVISLFCLALMLLTWLLPTAQFQYAFTEAGRNMMGIFDIFSYPALAFSFFYYIFIFILAVGAFYGILSKTGVYDQLISQIVTGFKSKENIFISIIIVIFAIVTSISGLSIGLMFIFPFVISVLLAMGYDKLMSATITVGSVVTGLIGTTCAGTTVGVINNILKTDVLSEMWTKIVILIIGIIILIYNVLDYAKKHRTEKVETNEKKSLELDKTDEITPAVIKKKSIIPMAIVFDSILILMVMAFISWVDVFEIKTFSSILLKINEFKFNELTIFEGILGTIVEFGRWTLAHIAIIILIGSVIVSIIYKIKLDDFIDGIKKGAKKALKPALLMMLVYVALIIVTYHPFQLVIYKFILELTKGFNLVTTTIVAFIASVFNVEPMYTAQSVLSYLTSIVTNTKLYPLIAIIFQGMYGLAMLIAPTSVVLIGTLSYLDISYFEWLKHIWKIFIQLLLVLIIIFTILLLI